MKRPKDHRAKITRLTDDHDRHIGFVGRQEGYCGVVHVAEVRKTSGNKMPKEQHVKNKLRAVIQGCPGCIAKLTSAQPQSALAS
jgi:hypothetical protein